ncbi:MAG: hypothetical protein KEFWMYNX_002063, partial [Candidatus Fervidibacter sp.]
MAGDSNEGDKGETTYEVGRRIQWTRHCSRCVAFYVTCRRARRATNCGFYFPLYIAFGFVTFTGRVAAPKHYCKTRPEIGTASKNALATLSRSSPFATLY